jgi:nitrosocyanin
MMMKIVWGLLAATLFLGGTAGHAADPATYTATIVNIEYQGSKIWVPGTLVVKKGTKVTLNLINNVPADPKEHGFAIPAYNIAEIVNRGEPKKVEFTADKAGIFPITCHLHPAHVGGELVVLE